MNRKIVIALGIGALAMLGVYTTKIHVSEEVEATTQEEVTPTEPVEKTTKLKEKEPETKSVIDQLVANNQKYALNFDLKGLPSIPSKHTIVVTCMDTRMWPKKILGLEPGQAHILRNAGGVLTEDVLRSLIISHYALGTNEIMLIKHTKCGVIGLKDETMNKDIKEATGYTSQRHYHGFGDLARSVKDDIEKVKNYPALPKDILVRGFVYDVDTGLLTEIT